MNSSPSSRSSRHGGADVATGAGDVLNTFALISVEKFLYLAGVVGAFVDRDANLAAWARHGAEWSPVYLPSISK